MTASKFQSAILFVLGVVPVRLHLTLEISFSLYWRASTDAMHEPQPEYFPSGNHSL